MTYMENTLYKLGEEVELLVAQGVQLKDIAILVRKNRSIPLIADYFDKNTSYKIGNRILTISLQFIFLSLYRIFMCFAMLSRFFFMRLHILFIKRNRGNAE